MSVSLLRFASLLSCSFVLVVSARAAEFFVAPDGKDDQPGTKEQPFATINRAQEAANAGDTVFIRGGKYAVREEQAPRKGLYAEFVSLTKSGKADAPIRYWAFPGEQPVFDLSGVRPAGVRIAAFHLTGSWIHVKGLEVTGMQVTIKTHTQSICFYNDGSHNVYEQLRMHDGQAIGIYSVKGSDNLFLNCDAWQNHDFTSEDGKGGNVDGFGCHPAKGATGNVFRGCRAWLNSDDGFDCITSNEGVTFEGCWAFRNGLSAEGKRLADGNGFKAGGYGSAPADRLPQPIPRHVVKFCLAVGNRSSGFYGNHHPGGDDWFNNTAYHNGANFNMLGREMDNHTDIPGKGHKLRDNLSYKGGRELVNLDPVDSDSANDSWDLRLKFTDADFVSLDESKLAAPRKEDGSLPDIDFMRPVKEGAITLAKGAKLGAFEPK